MPVYVVQNHAELIHFYPILRYLFANAEMFNVLKLRHGGAQCTLGSWQKMRKSLTHLYLIYINPQLAIPMRRLLIQLRNSLLPNQDKENKENKTQDESYSDDNGEDPRQHPKYLMTCPYCGARFQHQAIRHSRSTRNL